MDVHKILRNCASLNDSIMDLSEKELLELLEHERDGENRFTMIDRIYGRYNRLRQQRERMEFLTNVKG